MPGRIPVRIQGLRGWDPVLGRVRGGLPPMGEVSASSACGEGVWGPTAAVARTHSLCRWAHIVDLGARIQPVRAWESEIQWLGIEGVVVEM